MPLYSFNSSHSINQIQTQGVVFSLAFVLVFSFLLREFRSYPLLLFKGGILEGERKELKSSLRWCGCILIDPSKAKSIQLSIPSFIQLHSSNLTSFIKNSSRIHQEFKKNSSRTQSIQTVHHSFIIIPSFGNHLS